MRRFWVYPQPFNADIERKSLVSITVKTNKQNTKCGYGKRELDSTHKTREFRIKVRNSLALRVRKLYNKIDIYSRRSNGNGYFI